MVELRGYQLTLDYLSQNGFDRPILVRSKDGLDIRVPENDFSVQDVEDHVGRFRCNVYVFIVHEMYSRCHRVRRPALSSSSFVTN